MKSLNTKSISASTSHKVDRSYKEITINDLNNPALIKLTKLCRLCNQNLGKDIRLTSTNVLRQIYSLGLNTGDRTVKQHFLSFHKDIERLLDHLNGQLDNTTIFYTLPHLGDADFKRSR